ncbi:MAG: hypothetical protein SPE59_10550 [Treponema sp.]|nr:hypothetical protein [Treponema sp.]
MELLGIFILIWFFIISVYRFYLQIFVYKKNKILRNNISVDRILLAIPELAPLKELKNSEDCQISKIYKLIKIYKIIFWLGFLIIFIMIILN